MALPNGDLVTTVFDPQMAYPMDRRMQADTLNARDSISTFIRWEGMTVYVLENSTEYILQGGVANEFWVARGTGPGGGGSTFVGQYETADLLPTTGRSPGDYAFVGTEASFRVYNWDNVGGDWVAALFLSQNIVSALNGANVPGESNPFATIADIPGADTSDRIIDPGVLVINSETSATLTGASWVFGGVGYSYTGALTLTAKPTSPDNRFDIVTVSGSSTPSVEDGTEAEDPVVPTPSTGGHLVIQTIYRPHTEPDIVSPTPPGRDNVYQTLQVAGGNGNYAPIWQQNVQVNESYDFKIGYVFWNAAYSGSSNHRPLNGYVAVNFVTTGSGTTIDPARVSIVTNDPYGQDADFVLVQTGAAQVTLYARKTGYHGTMFFAYLGAKNATVRDNSLIDQGAYDTLPAGDKYNSWNGRGYVPSTGTTIQFDRPRQYGFSGTPVTGNLTLSTAYADDSCMAKVLHNHSEAPTFSRPGGVGLRVNGEYETGVDNLILMIIHKNASGDVVTLEVSISQDQS